MSHGINPHHETVMVRGMDRAPEKCGQLLPPIEDTSLTDKLSMGSVDITIESTLNEKRFRGDRHEVIEHDIGGFTIKYEISVIKNKE